VCFQCHLFGEERILRYGRSHFDFRPGDQVLDVWTVFVRGSETADGSAGAAETASHAEQMLASACYRASDGRLGCVSCHDPHSIPAAEQRVSFFRERCLQCHAAGGAGCGLPVEQRVARSAADSCIECHMPRITGDDMPHIPQTDHRVLKSPEARRAVASRGRRLLRVFGDPEGKLPESERERALGLLIILQAERSEDPEEFLVEAISKLEPWVRAVPDDALAAERLGAAYALSHQMEAAYTTLRAALQHDPRNERLLQRLAMVCHETGRLEESLGYARDLVELNPWNHLNQGHLAQMLARRGEHRQAIEAGEWAVEVRPSDFRVRGWLADIYRRAGQPDQARAHETARQVLAPRTIR
jgi:hypothetical protein